MPATMTAPPAAITAPADPQPVTSSSAAFSPADPPLPPFFAFGSPRRFALEDFPAPTEAGAFDDAVPYGGWGVRASHPNWWAVCREDGSPVFYVPTGLDGRVDACRAANIFDALGHPLLDSVCEDAADALADLADAPGLPAAARAELRRVAADIRRGLTATTTPR